MPSPTSNAYPETAFGGFSRVDGTVSFYNRVQALLEPDDIVLDVGCGRGAHAENTSSYKTRLHDLRSPSRKVIGVDIDTHAASNPTIDEFRLIRDPHAWPVENESVSMVVCDYVLEHIQDPDTFFSEMHRTLAPGGRVCIRTPNAYGYVALIAKVVPNRLHGRVVSRVQVGRHEIDFFPTYYQCNTRRRIESHMSRIGFAQCVVYPIEGEPAYLGFSNTLFWVASHVHRWLPAAIQSTLLAFAVKPVPLRTPAS